MKENFGKYPRNVLEPLLRKLQRERTLKVPNVEERSGIAYYYNINFDGNQLSIASDPNEPKEVHTFDMGSLPGSNEIRKGSSGLLDEWMSIR